VSFLDYLRASVVRKLEGVSDTDARRPAVASGTSLMSLVRHLTEAEVTWFQLRFSDSKETEPAGGAAEASPLADLIADYQRATTRNNQIVASCTSLEHRCAHADHGDLNLRWVLVHMIEETARHAGHADILREQLDGAVGR
jgi:Protein of unknown function (DUF664)